MFSFRQPEFPPFASCLMFELYKPSRNGEPYMDLLYMKSPGNIRILDIPGCGRGRSCTLKKWRETYKHIIPTQSFANACKLRKGEKLPKGGNPENR